MDKPGDAGAMVRKAEDKAQLEDTGRPSIHSCLPQRPPGQGDDDDDDDDDHDDDDDDEWHPAD